jgi:hypothetical protein
MLPARIALTKADLIEGQMLLIMTFFGIKIDDFSGEDD